VLASPHVSRKDKAKLRAVYLQLNVAQLWDGAARS
jgi:hypothetical protein